MPRKLLLLVPMLAATLGACSPAEPPLLIDGGETPATVADEDAREGPGKDRTAPAEND